MLFITHSVQQLHRQDLHKSHVSLHAPGKSILDSNICTSLVKKLANTEEKPTIEKPRGLFIKQTMRCGAHLVSRIGRKNEKKLWANITTDNNV